ncbi:MAG: hypothetical protein Q8J78_11630 [Moraxellaceae bacterium]|nr:hypothetical protein [Moraxellaceae bacterium]
MKFLFRSTAYVRIFRNRFVVQVFPAGLQAETSAAFSHPRLLIGDFEIAEKCLKDMITSLYKPFFLPGKPVLVMHPKEVLEGGLTTIEGRVLQELGLGAGAVKCVIWTGADLDAATLSQALEGSRQ